MNTGIKLSPNFNLAELCRTEVRGIGNVPTDELIISSLQLVCVRILEPVREHFGKPFTPNSGYRSPDVNKLIGGAPTSQHMRGQAVDFEVPGVSNYELAKWISENLIYDQLILENYTPGQPNSGWVHCSVVSGHNREECLTIKGKDRRVGLHE